MNAPVNVQALSEGRPAAFLCHVHGQITVKSRAIVTQQGRRFLTVVSFPAVNEYTAPAVVELRSEESLGDVGELFRGRVSVGGYRRSYKNPETGSMIQSASNLLDVVA